MSRPHLLLAAGWAYPPDALAPLANALSEDLEVALVPAEDLTRRLTAPAWIGGWSMGGMRAMEAAVERPELVCGLVLLASTPRFCSAADFPCGTPPGIVRAMARHLSSKPAAVLGDFFDLSASPESLAEEERAARLAQAGAADALAAGLHYLQQADLRDRMARLPERTLVLHGRADRIIPAGAAEWLAGHHPPARLVVHEQAGHEFPIRQVEWTADRIRDYVMG